MCLVLCQMLSQWVRPWTWVQILVSRLFSSLQTTWIFFFFSSLECFFWSFKQEKIYFFGEERRSPLEALAIGHCSRACCRTVIPHSRVQRRTGALEARTLLGTQSRGRGPWPRDSSMFSIQLGRIDRLWKNLKVGPQWGSWPRVNGQSNHVLQLVSQLPGKSSSVINGMLGSTVGYDACVGSGRLSLRCEFKDLCRSKTFIFLFLAKTFSSCFFSLRIRIISQVRKTDSGKGRWAHLPSSSSSWLTLCRWQDLATLRCSFIFILATLMYFCHSLPYMWQLWGTNCCFALTKVTQLVFKMKGHV